MSLTCALSNEVPEVAVVSPLSGAVFEKRLILKYIEEHGTDPINGDKLSEDMLIEIKTPAIVKPRPPSATSIPAILKSLQDEWDAVMLHSFTLRQQLQTARQELSHALYQHDAACRVIARLTKEVTAAREALATLKPKTGGGVGTGGGQGGTTQLTDASGPDQNAEEQQISPDVLEKLDNKARVLTADRKRRGKTVPEDLVKLEQLKNFKTLASHSGLHSVSIPGILAVDICPTDKNKILTGGNDKNAIIFNKDNEQVITQLKGHTKKVTSVIYHPNQENAITASPDGQIRIWHLPTAQTIQLVRAHDGPVTGVSLHATGDYILSTSTDEFWAFSDLQTGRILTKAGEPSIPHALTTAQFHPDGLIFGTGTSDSQIKIWDLKERLNVANFPGHSGSISAMSFSENGFYLATAADDSCVKLWDLRKLKNFKTIYLNDNYQVKDLCFDQSGTYLGVAGTDVRVYISKQWENICTFTDHTATATGVRFGDNGSFLVSVSLDRALKVYGLQQ